MSFTNFRLGLDIGTNSIGWCILPLENKKISPWQETEQPMLGVRIFSPGRDPKTGASLAADRRAARAARTRRDRYLRRRTRLMRELAEAALMPQTPSERKQLERLDPCELRARGLEAPLKRTELGRALFHLNQRRGFKSNRKIDRGDNEEGLIRSGTARLEQDMMAAGARTYGEFLHLRRIGASDQREIPSVRTRLTVRTNSAGKTRTAYDHYPARAHLEDEFDRLWATQQKFDPGLTEQLGAALRELIFYQRPLKPPKIGTCRYGTGERVPKAHPLEQRRVLYETVNMLRVERADASKRPLTIEERDTVVLALDGKAPPKSPGTAKVTLEALRKRLKLDADERFSLETTVREDIACDRVRMSLIHKDRFGPGWSALGTDVQWEIVQQIRAVETDEDRAALVAWLRTTYELSAAAAEAVADAPLPQGYGRLGLPAVEATLEALMTAVIADPDHGPRPARMDEAVRLALKGAHHADTRTGELLDALPYYGEVLERHVIPGSNDPDDPEVERYGRITNPTVHIALNQLRRLVNRIIGIYGKPAQIHVELARDLGHGKKRRAQIEREIKRNTDQAIRRGREIVEQSNGRVADNGANRLVMRLWEELGPDPLNRRCPYTGKTISFCMLWGGQCDVDHILPYSRTLDDSPANKTLCLREANRYKRNRSPWETFGETDTWETIAANLPNLPANKRWRFAPDAMRRFEAENGFLDRQLKDTQYLSRLARTYLDTLYEQGGNVRVVTGRATEMLRRHWGLNALASEQRSAAKAKDRTDHRHHAIDAAVIAAIDASLVQRMAAAAKHAEAEGLADVARAVDPPWAWFRDDLRVQLERIVVSHRPDRGRVEPGNPHVSAAKFHRDTALGPTGLVEDGYGIYVARKPLENVSDKDIDAVRDSDLAALLKRLVKGRDAAARAEGFAAVRAPTLEGRPNPYRGIRRVRLMHRLKKPVPVRGPNGSVQKVYGGNSNHAFELWRLPDGKVRGFIVQTFEAHQAGQAPRPHPAAKRILRLHQNDMVALDDSKFGPGIFKVESIDGQAGSERVSLVHHREANASARYNRKGDAKEDLYVRMTAGSLLKSGVRRVEVDEMGRVQDHGPVG